MNLRKPLKIKRFFDELAEMWYNIIDEWLMFFISLIGILRFEKWPLGGVIVVA